MVGPIEHGEGALAAVALITLYKPTSQQTGVEILLCWSDSPVGCEEVGCEKATWQGTGSCLD